MDQEVFALPDWYKAMTLSDRAAALVRSPGRSAAADDALADRRLARWREQEPFSQDGFFARRLALDSLTDAELHILLGEPPAAVRERESTAPTWLLILEEAFRQPAPETFPAGPSESPSIGFLNAVRPLLDAAYSRLVDGIREIEKRYPGAPFDADTAGPLLATSLPSSLLLRMNRTMVLELQLARRQGLLAGETPEERFRSFVESLRSPEVALANLRQYPVLARMVVETVDLWNEVSLEVWNASPSTGRI